MKFDSKGLKERLVPNLEKGVSMAEKCDELIQDIARNASDVQISFNGSKCITLIEEAEKYTNDICIATKVTVSMFDSAEKANMEIIDRLYSLDGDYFEEIFGTEDNYYGTSQCAIQFILWEDYNMDEEGKTIREVAETYNMTYEDAVKACTIINSNDVGACSYAAAVNTILTAYRYDPAAFEEDFGFPMFEVNGDGELVVNGTRLLLDMYIFYNSEENGGKLFKKAANGKLEVNDEYIEPVENSVFPYQLKGSDSQIYLLSYLMEDREKNTCYTTLAGGEYLESKNSSKEIKVEHVIYGNESIWKKDIDNRKTTMTNEEKEQFNCVYNKDELKKILKEYLDDNHVIYMYVSGKSEITYYSIDHESADLVTGAHAVYITGLTDEGVLVSSWGEDYIIPYEDLIENQDYSIYVCSVEDR